MPQYFYQLGNDLTKTPYSGPEGCEAIWSGTHAMQAIPATVGGLTVTAGDLLEIPLCAIPSGAKINSIKWAWDVAIANASSTAVFVLRKQEVSLYNQSGPGGIYNVTQTGVSTGTPLTTFIDTQGQTRPVGFALANGVVSGSVAGQGALPAISGAGSAAAPTVTAAANGSATIMPLGLEGTTYIPRGQSAVGGQIRSVLQDDYYLSLLITVGTTGAPVTGTPNIFVAVEGEFVGTL